MKLKLKSIRKFFIGILFMMLVSLFFELTMPGAENASGDHDQWLSTLTNHRKEKDDNYKKSSTSPLAGSKRLLVGTVQEGQKVFVVGKNRDFSISDTETGGVQFALEYQNKGWKWIQYIPTVTCKFNDQTVEPGTEMNLPAFFQSAGCLIEVFDTKDGLTFIVFDPLRPTIQHFSNLLYFEPDPKYAVKATIKILPNPEKITISTTRKLEKYFYRYAVITFELDGKELQLTALKMSLGGSGEDNMLFVPFADATSGKETYEVGRFLDIPEPQGSTCILDFNYCYNPLCNYSPAYNCPIPPLENNLDVPIKAGEKTYPH